MPGRTRLSRVFKRQPKHSSDTGTVSVEASNANDASVQHAVSSAGSSELCLSSSNAMAASSVGQSRSLHSRLQDIVEKASAGFSAEGSDNVERGKEQKDSSRCSSSPEANASGEALPTKECVFGAAGVVDHNPDIGMTSRASFTDSESSWNAKMGRSLANSSHMGSTAMKRVFTFLKTTATTSPRFLFKPSPLRSDHRNGDIKEKTASTVVVRDCTLSTYEGVPDKVGDPMSPQTSTPGSIAYESFRETDSFEFLDRNEHCVDFALVKPGYAGRNQIKIFKRFAAGAQDLDMKNPSLKRKDVSDPTKLVSEVNLKSIRTCKKMEDDQQVVQLSPGKLCENSVPTRNSLGGVSHPNDHNPRFKVISTHSKSLDAEWKNVCVLNVPKPVDELPYVTQASGPEEDIRNMPKSCGRSRECAVDSGKAEENNSMNISFPRCKKIRVCTSPKIMTTGPPPTSICTRNMDCSQVAVNTADDSSDEEVKRHCCRLKCRFLFKRQPKTRTSCGDTSYVVIADAGTQSDIVKIETEDRAVCSTLIREGREGNVSKEAHKEKQGAACGYDTLMESAEDRGSDRINFKGFGVMESGLVDLVTCDFLPLVDNFSSGKDEASDALEKTIESKPSGLTDLRFFKKGGGSSQFVRESRLEKDDHTKNTGMKSGDTISIGDQGIKEGKWSAGQCCRSRKRNAPDCGGLHINKERPACAREIRLKGDQADLEPAVSKLFIMTALVNHIALNFRGYAKDWDYKTVRDSGKVANGSSDFKDLPKDIATEIVEEPPESLECSGVSHIAVGATECPNEGVLVHNSKSLEERPSPELMASEMFRDKVGVIDGQQIIINDKESEVLGNAIKLLEDRPLQRSVSLVRAKGSSSSRLREMGTSEEQRGQSPDKHSTKTVHVQKIRPDTATCEKIVTKSKAEKEDLFSNTKKVYRPADSMPIVVEKNREVFGNYVDCLVQGSPIIQINQEKPELGSSGFGQRDEKREESEQTGRNSTIDRRDTNEEFVTCSETKARDGEITRGKSQEEAELNFIDAGSQARKGLAKGSIETHEKLHEKPPSYELGSGAQATFLKKTVSDPNWAHNKIEIEKEKTLHSYDFQTLEDDFKDSMCTSEQVRFLLQNSWDEPSVNCGIPSLLGRGSAPPKPLAMYAQECEQKPSTQNDTATKIPPTTMTAVHMDSNHKEIAHEYLESLRLVREKWNEGEAAETREKSSRKAQILTEHVLIKGSATMQRHLPEVLVREVFPSKSLSTIVAECKKKKCDIEVMDKEERTHTKQEDVSEEIGGEHLIFCDTEKETWLAAALKCDDGDDKASGTHAKTSPPLTSIESPKKSTISPSKSQIEERSPNHQEIVRTLGAAGKTKFPKRSFQNRKLSNGNAARDFYEPADYIQTCKEMRPNTTPPKYEFLSRSLRSHDKQLGSRSKCQPGSQRMLPSKHYEAGDAERIGSLIELRKSLTKIAREQRRGVQQYPERKQALERHEITSSLGSPRREKIKRIVKTAKSSESSRQRKGRGQKKLGSKISRTRKESSQFDAQELTRSQQTADSIHVHGATVVSTKSGSSPTKVHEGSKLFLSSGAEQRLEEDELDGDSLSKEVAIKWKSSEMKSLTLNKVMLANKLAEKLTDLEASVSTCLKITLDNEAASKDAKYHLMSSDMELTPCELLTEAAECTANNVPPHLIYENPLWAKQRSDMVSISAVRSLEGLNERKEESGVPEDNPKSESKKGRCRRKWRKPLKESISKADAREETSGTSNEEDCPKREAPMLIKSTSSGGRQERTATETKILACQVSDVSASDALHQNESSSECCSLSLEERHRNLTEAAKRQASYWFSAEEIRVHELVPVDRCDVESFLTPTNEEHNEHQGVEGEFRDSHQSGSTWEDRVHQCTNPKCLKLWTEAKSPSPKRRCLTSTSEEINARDAGGSISTEMSGQHFASMEAFGLDSSGDRSTSAACYFGEDLSQSEAKGIPTNADELKQKPMHLVATSNFTDSTGAEGHLAVQMASHKRPEGQEPQPAQEERRVRKCNMDNTGTEVVDGKASNKFSDNEGSMPTLSSLKVASTIGPVTTFEKQRSRPAFQVWEQDERSVIAGVQSGEYGNNARTLLGVKREIISPRKQRLSTVAVSKKHQEIAAQLAKEESAVNKERTSPRRVLEAHKVMQSPQARRGQGSRVTSPEKKKAVNLEALNAALIEKNRRHVWDDSRWLYKAAELQRVNEDLSGQIRELQIEIDNYEKQPQRAAPELDKDNPLPRVDEKSNCSSSIHTKVHEALHLPEVFDNKLISPPQKVQAQKSKMLESVIPKTAQLKGTHTVARVMDRYTEETGAIYGQLQEKVRKNLRQRCLRESVREHTLSSSAKDRRFRSPSPTTKIKKSSKQEAVHPWFIQRDDQVQIQEPKKITNLRLMSPWGHRRHEKVRDCFYTKPHIWQSQGSTDKDTPPGEFTETYKVSNVGRSPLKKLGKLSPKVSRMWELARARSDTSWPADVQKDTNLGKFEGIKSKITPCRRGLTGGRSAPMTRTERSPSPKKWGPYGQLLADRYGLQGNGKQLQNTFPWSPPLKGLQELRAAWCRSGRALLGTNFDAKDELSRRSNDYDDLSSLEQRASLRDASLPRSSRPATRRKVENETSDSTECWSRKASPTPSTSSGESLLRTGSKDSEGRKRNTKSSRGFKMACPASLTKEQWRSSLRSRYAPSNESTQGPFYTTAVIAPQIKRIRAFH